jgi:hypothetical protein
MGIGIVQSVQRRVGRTGFDVVHQAFYTLATGGYLLGDKSAALSAEAKNGAASISNTSSRQVLQ